MTTNRQNSGSAWTNSALHMAVVAALTMVWYALCLFHFGIFGTGPQHFSGWAHATLSLSVWGGLAGSVLLALRSHWAVSAYTAGLVGLMACSLNLFLLAEAPANLYALPMVLGMWLITLPTLLYASRNTGSEQPLDLGRFEIVE